MIALTNVIHDLEKKLQIQIEESEWLLKRFKQIEQEIINMKNTINELKEIRDKK